MTKPRKETTGKGPVNLYLEPATVEKLETLAKKNHRKKSTELAALVDAEYERVFSSARVREANARISQAETHSVKQENRKPERGGGGVRQAAVAQSGLSL